MEWNGLLGLVYGLLGGLFEFLPVSPQVHQAVYLKMMGLAEPGAGMMLAVHLGALSAVILSYYSRIARLMRGRRANAKQMHHGKRPQDRFGMLEWRWIRIALLPVVLSAVMTPLLSRSFYRLWALAILAVVNGIIVLIPHYMSQANKDARGMSALDALLVGGSGMLSIFPGISRIGLLTGVGSMRGMDRCYAVDFACLLSIPALAVLSMGDLVALLTAKNAVGAAPLFPTVLAFVGSAIAALLAIRLVRYLAAKKSFESLAYYSWGLGMFTLMIYLIG